ncbi:MAG: MlaA family lipoprotein [Victivallaceae bacterium]|nr:MlaA family lipoprotein [Victivallaceae bacterium]
MKRWLRFTPIFALLAFSLLIAGCRSASQVDEPAVADRDGLVQMGPWTPTMLETEVAGEDPIEGFNRSMFWVTDSLMDYVARPAGWVYCSIFPRPAIEVIDRVCLNLEYPARLMSTLGRAEWRGAWDETVRFMVNTSIGMGGMFDPAGEWWGFYSTESDFGQMFAAWGIGPGCTLVLPLCAQTNVRDVVGWVFDVAFDAKTYIPFAGSASAINRMVVAQDVFRTVVEGSPDRYKSFRELAALRRQLQLRMAFYRAKNAYAKDRGDVNCGRIDLPQPDDVDQPAPKPVGVSGQWLPTPEFMSRGTMVDTTRFVYFKPQQSRDYWYMRLSIFNRDFVEQMSRRHVKLGEGNPGCEYGFWSAPETAAGNAARPERLAIVMPGVGGSFDSNSTLALCERFNLAGYKVVSVDSAFSWRFMREAGNYELPGFVPDDVRKIRTLLAAIVAELKSQKLIESPEITLAGYSLGGVHALHIAAAEEKSDTLGIAQYVAIAPPVDLLGALSTIDKLGEVSTNWTRDEAVENLIDAGGVLMTEMVKPVPPYRNGSALVMPQWYRPRFTEDQASYLSALSLSMSIRGVVFRYHMNTPLPLLKGDGSWSQRNRLYDEIDKLSFGDYVDKILIPQQYPGRTRAELAKACSLRSIASTLAKNPKIRVIHTWDDFLLSGNDRDFLDRTLGGKLLWVQHGGHLGNLYLDSVQCAAVGE